MKTTDAIRIAGGINSLCKLLHCSRDAIYKWGAEVPAHRQYELEVKMRGRLKSDYTLQRQNARRRNDE